MAEKASTQDTQKQVQERWPTWTWALSIPQVGDILKDQSITDQSELESRIQATDWYKQNSDAVRHWQAELASNPATAANDIGQKAASINDAFQTMGLTADPTAQTDIATQALKFNWTADQVNDAVVQYARTHPAQVNAGGQGLIQTSVDQLKQMAANYYVPLDDGTANSWAQQVAAGEKKATDFQTTIESWAKNKFQNSPDVLGALGRGETVDNYFAPYKQEAAKLLNTSSDSVDFMNNPLYSKILNFADPKSGQNRVMSLGEMDNYLRNTPQFDHTPGAIQQASDIGQAIIQGLGKVA